MLRYLKIALLCLSVGVLLGACSLRYHSNYKKTDTFSTEGRDFIADHFQKVLFNAHINAFGKEASGLLFIKLMGKEQYRFVFMSQMGMKFFDVELNQGVFTVHQLVSYLDKKNVRKVLENDLRLLIQEPILQKPHYFAQADKQLLREKHQPGYRYYTYTKDQLLTKESTGCWFKNTIISYQYQGTGLPTAITIEHSKFNLKWHLYPVKKKLKLDE